MAIGRDGPRASQLQVCRAAAADYLLSPADAADIIDAVVTVIRTDWAEAAEAARLTEAQRAQLWGRQILNPFIFYR